MRVLFRKTMMVAFILCVNSAYGQSFSVKELESLIRLPQDDFESAVMRKKYVFDQMTEDEYDCNCRTYQYAFGRASYGKKASKFVVLFVYKDGYRGVTFQTTSQSEYLTLKNSLKATGFKLTKSGPNDEGTTVFYFYKKGNLNATLNSRVENENGEVSNSYFVNIENRP